MASKRPPAQATPPKAPDPLYILRGGHSDNVTCLAFGTAHDTCKLLLSGYECHAAVWHHAIADVLQERVGHRVHLESHHAPPRAGAAIALGGAAVVELHARRCRAREPGARWHRQVVVQGSGLYSRAARRERDRPGGHLLTETQRAARATVHCCTSRDRDAVALVWTMLHGCGSTPLIIVWRPRATIALDRCAGRGSITCTAIVRVRSRRFETDGVWCLRGQIAVWDANADSDQPVYEIKPSESCGMRKCCAQHLDSVLSRNRMEHGDE